MPNATGHLTTHEVREIRRLAGDGISTSVIANKIGCSRERVLEYSGSIVERIHRAHRYDRMVRNASAYVPTFGGGR